MAKYPMINVQPKNINRIMLRRKGWATVNESQDSEVGTRHGLNDDVITRRKFLMASSLKIGVLRHQ